MAIVQVSRITNRKGLTENLPQLAGAEFGWCIDSRRLFIGNGTLEAGAPVIGNTEILTEFSDITTLASYTYSDQTAVGYAADTGPTVRTVQQKLDDFADVRDFGAKGDGSTDDTVAINNALYQLYCRENLADYPTLVRRTLYFPAGTYVVSGAIKIPTYAKLVGEGANCTVIRLAPGSGAEYVAQYADANQQTGSNITGLIQNIEISSVTFQALDAQDVFLVEDANQCYFDSVNFLGPLTTTDISNNLSADDAAGVRFASTASLICTQITFDKCFFGGLTYGINTNQQIRSVTVSNCQFNTLYQGVVLGDGPVINNGPIGVRVTQSFFDLIYAEGVLYNNVTMNATAYNMFADVANGFSGVAGTPITHCILFGYDNNVSISDMFERSGSQALLYSTVNITGGSSATNSKLQLGRLARGIGRTKTLNSLASNQTVVTASTTEYKAFTLDYTIVRDYDIRHGQMIIVAQLADDSSQTLSYTDDYTENGDTGITLSVSQTGNTIYVTYSSTAGSSGEMTYSIFHLA